MELRRRLTKSARQIVAGSARPPPSTSCGPAPAKLRGARPRRTKSAHLAAAAAGAGGMERTRDRCGRKKRCNDRKGA